jgi:PKD repeat protein
VVLNLKSEGPVKSPIKMTATATDPDGEITGYLWDFGDGTPLLDWSNLSKTDHEYQEIGTYTVTVKVQDNKGKTNISSAVINIIEPPGDEGTIEDEGVFSADVLFWIIVIIIAVVVVVAILAIVMRIRREVL